MCMVVDVFVVVGVCGFVVVGIGNGLIYVMLQVVFVDVVNVGVVVVCVLCVGLGYVMCNGVVSDDVFGFVSVGLLYLFKVCVLLMFVFVNGIYDCNVLQCVFDML